MLFSRAPSHACKTVSSRSWQQLQPLQRSRATVLSRRAACRSSTKQSSSTTAQQGISAVPAPPLQLAKSAAAALAAAALLLSPMGLPAAPALAAGEDAPLSNSSSSTWGAPPTAGGAAYVGVIMMPVGEGQAGDTQPSGNPGWPMPSPMPHPPASPPQTPSPGPGPQEPSLPQGPPDLLPRQPPTPSPFPGPQGPNTPTPKPELPQLPDVPPQLLPPCNPNQGPPTLLPPCPDTPPPVRPMGISEAQEGHTTQGSGSPTGSSGSRADQPGAGGAAGGTSGKGSGVEVGVIGPVRSALPANNLLADTALLAPPLVGTNAGVEPAAAMTSLDAAFDAVLAPAEALAQSPVPSAKLDSSNMSINLDGRINPTGKQAAAPGSKDATSDVKDRSKGSSVVGGTGNAGNLNAFADFQPGSLTVQQVLKEAGKLGLQLLEVLVRIAVFVIKYGLKAFIWLVKAIGQLVQAST